MFLWVQRAQRWTADTYGSFSKKSKGNVGSLLREWIKDASLNNIVKDPVSNLTALLQLKSLLVSKLH